MSKWPAICSKSIRIVFLIKKKKGRNAAGGMWSGGEGQRLHRLSDTVQKSGWDAERRVDQLEQQAEQYNMFVRHFHKKKMKKKITQNYFSCMTTLKHLATHPIIHLRTYKSVLTSWILQPSTAQPSVSQPGGHMLRPLLWLAACLSEKQFSNTASKWNASGEIKAYSLGLYFNWVALTFA